MAPSAAASPIDGVWSASWTYEDLRSGPLLDSEELNDENWGDFTLTFDHGQMSTTEVNPRKSSSGSATFQVDGNTVVLKTKSGEKFAMPWRLEGDQLTFVRDVSFGVGPTHAVRDQALDPPAMTSPSHPSTATHRGFYCVAGLDGEQTSGRIASVI